MAELELRRRQAARRNEKLIPDEMTFRQFCEWMSLEGMLLDDSKEWTIKDNDAMAFLYDLIPSTLEQARGFMLAVMKAAQIGATVWEMLAQIYMALKFGPLVSGMFLPDRDTAAYKSDHRFMRTVRTMPRRIYDLFTHREDVSTGENKSSGEGNVLTRTMGRSTFLFLWTSGKVSTESRPMDILGLDEVQGMTLEQIAKVSERVSGSDIKMWLLLSTANLPDLDIDFYFKRGTQLVFHTRCPSCGAEHDLSDPQKNFPGCIKYNIGQVTGAPLKEYIYACPSCGGYIENPRLGRFVAMNEGAGKPSLLYPQTLSTTITPKDLILAWDLCVTGDQKKNYYNRKLARPYLDADQLLVSLDHCRACAAEGMRVGLVWEKTGRDTYMGIDQMGGYHAIIIKRRLNDGRQAVVHTEAVFITSTQDNPEASPWDRSAQLMELYGVSVCVLEHLPNWDNAKAFANRFPGRVFIVDSYSEDQITWKDAMTRSDRKTEHSERLRYTCSINQYKAMQTSLMRIKNRLCLFPDPSMLEQDIIEKGRTKRVQVVNDLVFLHFTKTALVVETADDRARTSIAKQRAKARDSRAYVAKLDLDPHFSYANMLCDVAWSRAFGSSLMVFADTKGQGLTDGEVSMTSILPVSLANHMQSLPSGVCGRCVSYREGRCEERSLRVLATDPECWMFVER